MDQKKSHRTPGVVYFVYVSLYILWNMESWGLFIFSNKEMRWVLFPQSGECLELLLCCWGPAVPAVPSVLNSSTDHTEAPRPHRGTAGPAPQSQHSPCGHPETGPPVGRMLLWLFVVLMNSRRWRAAARVCSDNPSEATPAEGPHSPCSSCTSISCLRYGVSPVLPFQRGTRCCSRVSIGTSEG